MARNPLFHRLVLTLAVSVLTPSLLPGQGFFKPMQRAQSGRFIEPPRGVQQQIREAERALDEDRYSDAVVRLGDLLSAETTTSDDLDLSGQDFFLELNQTRATGVPVTKSLLRKAREMIGALPPDALETYELRYGPLARKLLSEAASTNDWRKVRQVRRKYFHTMAGYESSALLAQHEMFAGHPLAASILLDDVVTVPRAIGHLGKGILLLHASAARLAGRELTATAPEGDDEVVVGGKPDRWPDDGELSGWLDQRFGTLDDFRAGQLKDYPVFGAGPDRNGASSGQMPLTNLRWQLDTTASPRQKRTVRNLSEELATSGKLPPPSWIPLRVGDQLLMRTTERLVGVDYRTGKRVWTYPWQSSYEFFDEEEASLDGLSVGPDPGELLSQRVWNDVPYGQISSDGKRAFILDDLREVEMAAFSPMINLRGTRPADTGTNTLVALDLATEGKLLWRLGAGSDTSSALSDAFFLGPPLPLDNLLYVMVEIAGDINLSCLDPATGRELWRQQLVAVESGGIDSDPIRRVAGAMPTYYEGVLICPTGAGAMVAIDLGDRMLRWGVNYDRNREMSVSIRGRSRGLEPSQLMQRWYSGAAIAAENSVVVTPIESDRLFGFDLVTGKSLFSQQARKYKRYMAGIRDGHYFVVGGNQVEAFKLRSGKSAWVTPDDMLAAGQQISGCGVFGQDEYLLPTTSNQIIRISLKDGKVIDRRNTRYPLGNLVAVDGEIIAQGPTSLAVAFGETTLEPIVNRILREDPDNFEALVRKSELLIQRGDREEALRMLATARRIQPDNDEVRMLSVSAMLGTLREAPAVDEELVKTLDGLIDRPSQRVELLSLRIKAALASRNYQEAAGRLIDLSSLVVGEPLLETSAAHVVNDSSRHCSLDAWIAARVHELTLDLDEDDLDQVSEMIRRETASKQRGSSSLLHRIVRHFGSLQGVDPIRDELARRLRDDDANLELERLALSTRIPSRRGGLETLTPDRLLMLADAYTSGGMSINAIDVVDELESRRNPVLADRLGELRELVQSKISVAQWPRTAELEWDSRTSRIRPMTIPQRVGKTHVLAGQAFEGWRLISEGTSPLAIRDPTGLMRRIPLDGGPIDESDKESQICGGVMVVVTVNGLIGLDLYHLLAGDGEAVLWRRGLSGDSGPATSRGSSTTPFGDQVFRYNMASGGASKVIPEFELGPILGDRVLMLQGGDLMAVDLLTAETLWRNSTAPKRGSVLSDGRRVAVVSAETKQIVFYDLLDGRKLDSEPWEHGDIWASAGTHVLSYRRTGSDPPLQLSLVNPFTGDVILQHKAHGANRTNAAEPVPSTHGRIVEGRYLALLGNDGQALIWDIIEGREIGRPQLPAYADLQGLQVMMLSGRSLMQQRDEDDQQDLQIHPGQLVLLPKRSVERSRHLQTTNGSYHHTTHGVHAVSLRDGSLRWGQQFERPWGCTLTQPAETPILLFTRSPSTYTNSSRRKTLEVLVLDVRDGNAFQRSEPKPILSTNNELETRLTVQPGLERVIANVGSEILTYKFGKTDDDQDTDR